MPQNLPQGVDHLIFFPPLPLQYSTQEAPDLDSTKSASHKTQVVSLSFYPSSKKKKKKTAKTQPQTLNPKLTAASTWLTGNPQKTGTTATSIGVSPLPCPGVCTVTGRDGEVTSSSSTRPKFMPHEH